MSIPPKIRWLGLLLTLLAAVTVLMVVSTDRRSAECRSFLARAEARLDEDKLRGRESSFFELAEDQPPDCDIFRSELLPNG
jgi:hypothetical protein